MSATKKGNRKNLATKNTKMEEKEQTQPANSNENTSIEEKEQTQPANSNENTKSEEKNQEKMKLTYYERQVLKQLKSIKKISKEILKTYKNLK